METVTADDAASMPVIVVYRLPMRDGNQQSYVVMLSAAYVFIDYL